MAASRAERVARNESIFRDANEQLRASFELEQDAETRLPFLCECANPRCTRVLLVSLEEYAEVREHPARFLTLPDELAVLPGHGPTSTVGRERATNPFLVGLVHGRAGPA